VSRSVGIVSVAFDVVFPLATVLLMGMEGVDS
jgi:hypothetical protein